MSRITYRGLWSHQHIVRRHRRVPHQWQGRNPCVIPVGGSNALGTWGYLEAAREMDPQLREAGITDVALVRCQSSDCHGLSSH